MLRFWKKQRKSGGDEESGLRLVSLHIPKTAGTSFRHILKREYGENAVARLDIPLGSGRAGMNRERYERDRLPEGLRVIHGHFCPADLYGRFPETVDVAIITWVRDPVERVISNYFYLEKRLRTLLDEEGRGVNILSKMQRSLLEYARADVNRNRQAKFLRGRELEEFAFVAVQEFYAEELEEMGRLLDWRERDEIKVNVTGSQKRDVPDAVRAEIAALNAEDVALYHRALHLRQRRKDRAAVQLISLHIPKTAGTSFYRTLREVYPNTISPAYRRRDVKRMLGFAGDLHGAIPKDVTALHGHLTYTEAKPIAAATDAKVIAWLRDPVERVISNYRFFRAGLRNAERNAAQYAANRHRLDEDLLTYAGRPENQNVMARFLNGASIERLYFVGIQEFYADDLDRLARLLNWPKVGEHRLNTQPKPDPESITDADRRRIAVWNQEDAALYRAACERRQRELRDGM